MIGRIDDLVFFSFAQRTQNGRAEQHPRQRTLYVYDRQYNVDGASLT